MIAWIRLSSCHLSLPAQFSLFLASVLLCFDRKIVTTHWLHPADALSYLALSDDVRRAANSRIPLARSKATRQSKLLQEVSLLVGGAWHQAAICADWLARNRVYARRAMAPT